MPGSVQSSHRAVARAALRPCLGLAAAPDSALAARTQAMRAAQAAGQHKNGFLAEAVTSAAAEAFRRARGVALCESQVVAGLVAFEGGVAELADGEGKSAGAGLAACLGSLCGGVHVAVLDDYLACRDHAWFAPVFGVLGVTAGVVTTSSKPEQRRGAYQADITYGSYRQFVHD